MVTPAVIRPPLKGGRITRMRFFLDIGNSRLTVYLTCETRRKRMGESARAKERDGPPGHPPSYRLLLTLKYNWLIPRMLIFEDADGELALVRHPES